MAAGLDPARFWDITPRLYALEMEGANRLRAYEKSMVWWSAMMPQVSPPPSFETFTGKPPDKHEAVAACIQRWDAFDRALNAGKKGSS